MKVLVGGLETHDLEADLESRLRQQMAQRAINLSRPRLQRLQRNLQAVAQAEAEQLFPVIVRLIQQTRGDVLDGPELTYEQLMQGAGVLTTGLPDYVSTAPLQWKPLNINYYDRKVRFYRNADNMFMYFGDLRRYFARYGDSIVRTRLGGVEVTLNIPEIEDTFYYDVRNRSTALESYKNIILGNLTVKMFPNLSPALLSIMKGHSWNEQLNQSGELEELLFEGTQTVIHKLMNRPHMVKTTGGQSANTYRPLVLPAVQFWIQVRIPNALARVLKEFVRRAAVRSPL